jgi:hypothetical protein
VASAIAPYLGVKLKAFDPRIPFLLASTSLALCAYALSRAARGLGRRRARRAGRAAVSARTPRGVRICDGPPAIGFQVHFSINSSPSYLRFAPAAELPHLMPLFLGRLQHRRLSGDVAGEALHAGKSHRHERVPGRGGAHRCANAYSLDALVAAQLVAGAAWSAALVGAFALATELGSPGGEGAFTGALFSILAIAAATRIALVVGEVPGGHRDCSRCCPLPHGRPRPR